MPACLRRLILGIDEAGYGPNMGPMVIACSVWLVDEPLPKSPTSPPAAESLLDRLAPSFLAKPGRIPFAHLPLGDSKAIYSSGDSTDALSIGVRFWLKQQSIEHNTFDAMLKGLAPECTQSMVGLPWYQPPRDKQLPCEALPSLSASIPAALDESAQRTLRDAGLQFLGLAVRLIDERRFNRGVEQWGNKASLLSHVSLQLAVDCLKEYAMVHHHSLDAIHVYCDKHGGRNRYQALLMAAMPELWFDVIGESRSRSDYRSSWNDRELQWSFLAKGDRLLASALASMTAKWMREGLMARLNGFWQSHLPWLKPTAGYPVDAKRFRAAIEPVADRLAFPVSDWWRFR